MTSLKLRNKKNEDAFRVEVEDKCIGTLRSAGTYIGVLLQLEEASDRAKIIADVLRRIGILPEEVADSYHAITCTQCGMSNSPMNPCECKK